jgi:modulator of FtsH protease HflC
MKGATGVFVALLAIVAIVVIAASIFTVGQTEQALVLRFGDPVAGRGLVSEPGLHFKIPFIENVVLLDKRILDVETPTQEVLASDNTRVEIDSFLKYRIVDPLKFYQTVGDTDRANDQLGYILNSAVRRVLGDADLGQIVSADREALMASIRQQVNQQADKLGVSAVDVRIRRTDLPQQISEKVFSRMQSEWAREAALFRAQGAEESQEIRAKADRDAVVLRADAQRDADRTRGAGDAERARIFAAAFGKDPDFFAFYRSMQAYTTGLKPSNTRMVLSPKSAFFQYFWPPSGTNTAAPAH